MHLNDFHYELPPDLIARYPLAQRSASRLLQLDRGSIRHGQFRDVVDLLQPNDLLVFNNTRVIPARLYGHKESGGRVELLIERITGEHEALAMIRASKPPKSGSLIHIAEGIVFEVIARQEALYALKCHDSRPILDILAAVGEIPLPHYFHRAAEASDRERYQTVYAQHDGSVAAPTAGLHFDLELLAQIRARGIASAFLTLHVGLGTFAPVRVDNIQEHRMHKESITVSTELCAQIQATKACGGRVVAVGTTTARALETASLSGAVTPYSGETEIFIYPGFQFHCVDVLITNFHLPSSTLLMLVCALGGYQQVMAAYREAVQQKYRFFSYGDAMWVVGSGGATAESSAIGG